MSQDEVLVSRIRGDLLKGFEDAPLFPEYLEDGGKEEQQWESHSQLDEVTPGGQPLQQQREAERQLRSSIHCYSLLGAAKIYISHAHEMVAMHALFLA